VHTFGLHKFYVIILRYANDHNNKKISQHIQSCNYIIIATRIITQLLWLDYLALDNQPQRSWDHMSMI